MNLDAIESKLQHRLAHGFHSGHRMEIRRYLKKTTFFWPRGRMLMDLWVERVGVVSSIFLNSQGQSSFSPVPKTWKTKMRNGDARIIAV